MKKGILFTLETVIAILMILFIVVFIYRNPFEISGLNIIELKKKAYVGLIALERTGELRKEVIENDAAGIKNKLEPFIPGFLTYEVVLYNSSLNSTIANTTNYNSTIDEQPNVIVVNYLIAGDADEYNPRDVRVFIWGFD